jgi:hypothetical protein
MICKINNINNNNNNNNNNNDNNNIFLNSFNDINLNKEN